jgi:hypothetical protein
MAGKKQKSMSMADALAATRSAKSRVLALAARLEETERTIIAAMTSATPAKPAAAAPPSAPVKRPVGRPRTRPLPEVKAPVRKPATRGTTGRRPVGRPPKS